MADTPKPARPSQGVDVTLTRNGGLSYLEIPALDSGKSAQFYERVLGWKVDRSDVRHAKFSDAGGYLIGRWCVGRPPGREAGLLAYFYVERIHDAVAAVSANSGEVVRAPYTEGNLLVATVRDPAGNCIGLWQAVVA